MAESALRSKLCQIEQLTPLADEGDALDGRLETSFSLVDKVRRVLAVLMAAVFAFSLYSWAGQRETASSKSPLEGAVKFKVTGQLPTGGAQGDPSEWTVFVLFPELPYEVGGRLEDDTHGQFAYQLDLEGVERPRRAQVEVEHDGLRWKLPAQISVPRSGNLSMGLLTLVPPPKPEEPPIAKPSKADGTGQKITRGRPHDKENLRKALEARKR